MSERGVEAVRADRAEVLALAASLSEEEWLAPSGCAGWRVQDVVAHMACTFRAVVEPASLPPGVPGDLEATQEVGVAERRDWPFDKVLAEYADLGERTIEALAGLQADGVRDVVVPIENAGRFPLHLVANALAFDHYCHLRNDLLRPRGPIDRPAPPHDELRVGAALEWLIAGLPQMPGPAIAEAVRAPVVLRLTGPGGGEWTLRPGDPVDVVPGAASDATAEVTSPAAAFVVWSTHREPWRDAGVTIEGDRASAEPVLDAIHLF